jgi:hypothetical protein
MTRAGVGRKQSNSARLRAVRGSRWIRGERWWWREVGGGRIFGGDGDTVACTGRRSNRERTGRSAGGRERKGRERSARFGVGPWCRVADVGLVVLLLGLQGAAAATRPPCGPTVIFVRPARVCVCFFSFELTGLFDSEYSIGFSLSHRLARTDLFRRCAGLSFTVVHRVQLGLEPWRSH